MAKLIAAMPTQTISNLLIKSFEERVDWHLHVLHLPMFRKECEIVWSSLGRKEDGGMNATWWATYFMVRTLLPARASILI